jgi:hypothetical protein
MPQVALKAAQLFGGICVTYLKRGHCLGLTPQIFAAGAKQVR